LEGKCGFFLREKWMKVENYHKCGKFLGYQELNGTNFIGFLWKIS
jgi:hypothetical protein